MRFAKALPGKTRAKILTGLVAGASIAFTIAVGGLAAAQTAHDTCGALTAGAQRLSCFRKHGDPVPFYVEACFLLASESIAGKVKHPLNSHIARLLSMCGGNPDKAVCETIIEILAKDKAPKNILTCTGGG